MLKGSVTMSLKTIIFYLSNLFLFNVILAGLSPSLHYEGSQIKWICCFWAILFSRLNGNGGFPLSGWTDRRDIIPIPLPLRTGFRLLLDTIFIIIPLSICDYIMLNGNIEKSTEQWDGEMNHPASHHCNEPGVGEERLFPAFIMNQLAASPSLTFLLSSLNQLILLEIATGIEKQSGGKASTMTSILPILLIPLNIPIIIFSIYQEVWVLGGLIIFGFASLFLPLFFRRSG